MDYWVYVNHIDTADIVDDLGGEFKELAEAKLCVADTLDNMAAEMLMTHEVRIVRLSDLTTIWKAGPTK